MKRLFHRKNKSKTATPDPASAAEGPSPTPSQSRTGAVVTATSSSSSSSGLAANARPAAPPGMVPVQGQQGAFVPRPPRVQDVGNAIGWSVAMSAFDYGYLLELADYLASSASASKDAAKALAKEFKVSPAHPTVTAVLSYAEIPTPPCYGHPFAARHAAGPGTCSPLDRDPVPQHRYKVPP